MHREGLRRDELAWRREPFAWPVEDPPAVVFARVEARARQIRRRKRLAVAAVPLPVVLVALLVAVLMPGMTDSSVRTVRPADDRELDADVLPTSTTNVRPSGDATGVSVSPVRLGPTAAATPTSTRPPAPAVAPRAEIGAPAPMPSASTGRVAFVREGRIWVVNADGSGGRPVTAEGEEWWLWEWAHDGRLFAVRHRPSATGLVALDVDAGTMTRIGDQAANSPRLSPDGNWISYNGVAPDPNSTTGAQNAVWVMRDDGTERRMLVAGGNLADWTHDGKHLVYQVDDAVYIVGADGQNPRRVVEGYWNPHASPVDDRVIAMRLGEAGWALDVFGDDMAAPREVVPSHNMRYAWSPDGEWIAIELAMEVSRCETAGLVLCSNWHYNVWLVRPDGTGLHQLTTGARDTQLVFGPPAKRP